MIKIIARVVLFSLILSIVLLEGGLVRNLNLIPIFKLLLDLTLVFCKSSKEVFVEELWGELSYFSHVGHVIPSRTIGLRIIFKVSRKDGQDDLLLHKHGLV